MSVNKVILVGNLGNDPEIRQFENGGMIANISIATSEKWRDRNTGEAREHTEWHRVVLNNRLAEIAQQYLRKGSQVYIEGSIRTRKYTDAQGIERYSTEVRGDSMQMLGSRNNGDYQGGQGGMNQGGYGANQGAQSYNNNRGGYQNQANNNRGANQFGNQGANQAGFNNQNQGGFNQDFDNSQSYNQGNGGMNAMGNQGNNSFQNSVPAPKAAPKPSQANQNAITPAPAVSDDDMPF